jgi:uncharacterized protein (TIGR02271 family)
MSAPYDGGLQEPTGSGEPRTDQLTDPLTDPLTEPLPVPDGEASVIRHEEKARVEQELHETGRVRVRKAVETVPVEEVVPRNTEQVDFSERIPAEEHDTGEVITLDDGSVSIPVFEEVLVVTKKLVVRERVIVRKETVVDEYRLQTELRREHVTVESDDGTEVTFAGDDRP